VQQVVVEPGDQDRFVMTAREAARACQAAQDEKSFQDEFERFLLYFRDRGLKIVEYRSKPTTHRGLPGPGAPS
jgi:hypothetical protein